MTKSSRRVAADRAALQHAAAPAAARWLLFVHQLPPTGSNLRVRTWRRLQQLGALAIKQAVYVLPDSPGAREDFEWLKTEIESAGGEAAVFAAASLDAWSDDGIVEEFRRGRQDAYAELARELDAIVGKLDAPRRRRAAPPSPRLAQKYRERFAAIERIDFFGSAGRDRVVTLLGALEQRTTKRGRPATTTSSVRADPATFHRRLWVTRPRPGVDRMSSAWLIRRFIDPDARFGFAVDRDAVPEGAIAFDMFGVELTHRGEHCTFETLCVDFGLDQPAIARLATIVHDLDFKEPRASAPEAATVETLIEGLQLAHADDDELLAAGIALFESLYRAFAHAARPAGPRALARAPRPAASPDRPSSRRRRTR
jgi:hypothetical protein